MRRWIVAFAGLLTIWLAIAAIYLAQASEDYGLIGHVVWYRHAKAPVPHYLYELATLAVVVVVYQLGRLSMREDLR